MTDSPTRPERIDLAEVDDPRDVVHRAVACLAQGGIVGLATETVYGLAGGALRLETLARLRGGEAPRPLTLLLRGPVEVADWVPGLSELGWRLARRAWPGPVTLVFPAAESGGLAGRIPPEVRALLFPNATIALRVPSHPFLREVLRLHPGPLALARLDGPDDSHATTADALADRDGIAMLVDDGPTEFGGPATVVQVDGDRWTIARPGVVDEATLRRMAGTIFLFVCTGNTCRSPMAEALCKVLLADRLGCAADELEGRGYVVLSAGMAAAPGMPAAAHAVDVVQGRGGSLAGHSSRQLTADLIRHADHILAMTNDQFDALLDHDPEVAPRARLLHPRGGDVADPVGSDRETYLRTARSIEEYLGLMLDALGL